MKGKWYRTGAVSLVFLIIIYQTAVFLHKAAVTRIIANRDCPDTVFICRDTQMPESVDTVKRESLHSAEAEKIYSGSKPRRYENFRFDPNTASAAELERLGFSAAQAASIVKYRASGGRFRRKGDFAKSFVVSDSVFRRLEPYIDIPLLDINKADSAALDGLPGIGPYFAAKIISYRTELGGYSRKEQLMDIHNFSSEKYAALEDLVYCSAPERPFDIWSAGIDSIRAHPYIRNHQTARAIVMFRENTPREQWSLKGLREAGIISEGTAAKLAMIMEDPERLSTEME